MLVQDIMTKGVVAIGPDLPIGDVFALMAQKHIRHFPILEDAQLVGIVSDRDVRSVGAAYPGAPVDVTLKDPVARIMVAPVITAHRLDPVEEAAKTLHDFKIGALPVLQDDDSGGDNLVGIVTSIDFLEAFTKMAGVGAATSRLEVEVDDRPGVLADLLARIAERNVNVSSVMTTHQEPGTLTFALRVGTIDARALANTLSEAGFSILWPGEK